MIFYRKILHKSGIVALKSFISIKMYCFLLLIHKYIQELFESFSKFLLNRYIIHLVIVDLIIILDKILTTCDI